MTNATNTNANTNTNYQSADWLLRHADLMYNEVPMLHAGEWKVLRENWDGQAILREGFRDGKRLICVHNGAHHLDETFCIMLLSFFCEDIEVICSRNVYDWDKADLVIDVGEGLLDHHGTRAEKGVSAATRLFLLLRNSYYDGQKKWLWEKMAEVTVKVAALDTGMCNPEESPFPWVYTALQAGAIRDVPEPELLKQVALDILRDFDGAVVEGWEWRRSIEAAVVAEAKQLAKESIEKALAAAGESGLPIFPMAARYGEAKEALWRSSNTCPYYLGQEKTGDWKVLCAAPKGGKFSPFTSMKLIPIEYRGLCGDALSEKTGLPDAIFCHAAGFIAGFKSFESAKAFAELCLKQKEA